MFKRSIVLSAQVTQFQAATYSGDLEANFAKIAALGYDGVELAIRDPQQVDVAALDAALIALCNDDSCRWCRRTSPDFGSCANRLLGKTYCQIHARAALGYLRASASGRYTLPAPAVYNNEPL